MSLMPSNKLSPNLYEILGLPTPSSQNAVTQNEIKAACRVSLLLNHPDKTSQVLSSTSSDATHDKPVIGIRTYPMHLIYRARTILSNPTLRAAYDVHLQQATATSSKTAMLSTSVAAASGMDVVDLDDLVWRDLEAVWTRACRCGNARGFEVGEEELEEAVRELEELGDHGNADGMGYRYGDVVVGCRGCSLGILVIFAVDEGSLERY